MPEQVDVRPVGLKREDVVALAPQEVDLQVALVELQRASAVTGEEPERGELRLGRDTGHGGDQGDGSRVVHTHHATRRAGR